jgi:rubrerythrin
MLIHENRYGMTGGCMAEMAGKTNLDIVRILEICGDIELHCAELYRYYAEIFLENPELSGMWTKTAQEEDNHASQFVLAIKLRRQGMIGSVAVDPYKAENTLRIIKSVYAGVRQNKPAVIDALRSAIKLEERLEEFHMTTVALFTDEAHKNLFNAMMQADQHHLAIIEAAYQKELTARK